MTNESHERALKLLAQKKMREAQAQVADLQALLTAERENADRLAGALESWGMEPGWSASDADALAAHMKMRGK